MNDRGVRLISVPFWLGGGRAGVEFGPEDILGAGLGRQIRNLGIEVAADYEVSCPRRGNLNSASPNLKYLQEIKEMSGLVGEQVYRAVGAKAFPLVLGGDHTVSIGTLAGLTAHYRNLGIIWFDAHGMVLAIAMGMAAFKLTDIPGAGALINKKNVVIIGTRDLDPGEKELIRSQGIACFSMHDIDRLGIAKVLEEAMAIAGDGTDGIHLSFDMDCLDPVEASGVSTPVPGGLSYREAHLAMEMLAESGRITSMDMVELNPMLDYEKKTTRLAVELTASLLGKKIV